MGVTAATRVDCKTTLSSLIKCRNMQNPPQTHEANHHYIKTHCEQISCICETRCDDAPAGLICVSALSLITRVNKAIEIFTAGVKHCGSEVFACCVFCFFFPDLLKTRPHSLLYKSAVFNQAHSLFARQSSSANCFPTFQETLHPHHDFSAAHLNPTVTVIVTITASIITQDFL